MTTLDSLRNRLIDQILTTKNEKLLKAIEDILQSTSTSNNSDLEHSDFWTTLSEEEKEDILKGIKEADNGDVVDYNEFISKHK
ncbi:hypothetical protein [Roseivirga pacifica]|uniref:hypothetical protein n=1 Tax=Roseivirga pacifica TaxID=1267423 RepID=UPI0020941EB3|nr:hypothetical protein [Roseivirga pacifica]MCO6360890.1 hypothetical protein [Roseivirga pacifica]MCO6368779.1 hypothetical protein [Roseivirga pacifica]MCO6372923.1 hypothetical protein [Roseivirga pacifica]MCO6376983.1 hypothetical protein [Roseivirga pacifica]MCO6377740.1 hypothetical protein [Roseivirga pacifica]